MNALKILWPGIALTFFCLTATAQGTPEASSTIIRPAQLTFLSPLGTNGLESGKVTNRFSVNLIAGYAGGLQGVEFGGVANVLKGDMLGAQFAGFGNTVAGEVTGAQFAGFYNVTSGRLEGAQFAGFANIAGTDTKAGQFAGFANLAAGQMEGMQAAGFANVATGNVVGAQAAGFANTAIGDVKGAQIAGFTNIAAGDVTGFQIAGFANVASGHFDGVQIAGFLNAAGTVKGAQIGFINVADSVDGIALGFISFVKNGYRALEVSGHETLFGNLTFKTGTERFYNIFTTGLRPGPHGMIWGYGYGVGTLFAINDRFDASVDATATHLNDGEWFTDDLNLLNKLDLSLSWQFNESVELFGGASFNVLVSQREDGERNLIGSDAVPWSLHDRETFDNSTLIRMYPGLRFGLRI